MNCCENAYFTEDSSAVFIIYYLLVVYYSVVLFHRQGVFHLILRKVQEGKINNSSSYCFCRRKGMVRVCPTTKRTAWVPWVQLIMADIRNTANVIQDSSHTSGDKLIYSNVYSEVQQKNSPLELNSREVYTFAGKIQHSPCWEAQSLTWWSCDLFWSFNCTPGVSEQLDVIFQAILPRKITPLFVCSPHWSYFISQVFSASRLLLRHWRQTLKQLVFEQLPGSAPTLRTTGLLSHAVGASSLKSIWCFGTSPGSVSPSAA